MNDTVKDTGIPISNNKHSMHTLCQAPQNRDHDERDQRYSVQITPLTEPLRASQEHITGYTGSPMDDITIRYTPALDNWEQWCTVTHEIHSTVYEKR